MSRLLNGCFLALAFLLFSVANSPALALATERGPALDAARVYLNPNTGRFWTMDSYEGSNRDPLTLHKYLYCHANPINRIDPSGLKAYLYLLGQDSQGLPLRKAAELLSSQLSLGANDKVVIQDISGFEDFNKALKENTDIAELNYIGHGGPGILFIGVGKEPDTNITEEGGKHSIGGVQFESRSLRDLHTGNVRRDATINLYSCFSSRPGLDYRGLNVSFMEHFDVTTRGGFFSTNFRENGKPYTRSGYGWAIPKRHFDFSWSMGLGF